MSVELGMLSLILNPEKVASVEPLRELRVCSSADRGPWNRITSPD